MAGRADIQAGRAHVSLYVDSSALVKGLNAAGQKLQSFGAGIAKLGGGMMGMGAAVLAPLGAMVKGFADAGSALADMSARTGVGVETLSSLGYAAGMTGASIEDVEKALSKMARAGIGADKLGAIADKIAAMKNPAERTAFAIKTFGKSGASLIPMLSGGAAGLAEFRAEAERLGIVMSSEDAASADALGDAMDKVKASLKGVAMQIGAALAPAVTFLAEKLASAVAIIVAFVRENRQMVVVIAAVAVGIMGLGSVFVGLGGTVALLGMALGGIATLLGAILSPIGLLIAGIVGGTAAFLAFTETGRGVVVFLQDEFGGALAFVQEIIKGISDAFTAGDWKLAANIAWAGVLVAWEEAKLALFNSWNTVLGAWDELWVGMSSVFDGYMTTMQSAWNTLFAWIAEKLLSVWNIVEQVLGAIGMMEQSNTVGDALRYLTENTGRINSGMAFEKQQRDAERGAGLSARAAERSSGLSTGVASARDELAKLTSQAAEAAAIVVAKKQSDVGKVPGIVAPEAGGSMGSAATFSSSALAALGQGGGPMDKLVKVNEDQKKIAERQLKTAVNSESSLSQLAALLTIS